VFTERKAQFRSIARGKDSGKVIGGLAIASLDDGEGKPVETRECNELPNQYQDLQNVISISVMNLT
jgi:hypothetical protein